MSTPRATGKSLCKADSTKYLPMPGMLNIFSTTKVPVIRAAVAGPKKLRTGIKLFRKVCRIKIWEEESPFAFAVFIKSLDNVSRRLALQMREIYATYIRLKVIIGNTFEENPDQPATGVMFK